jgi:AcrR family transcriptional regulator
MEEHGRVRQRRRTRKAIIMATIDLLSTGTTPSVAEIAEAADVSRRTVYQYFPALDRLLVDAAATASQLANQPTFGPADDIEARMETFARTAQLNAAETEQFGRTLIRLTMDAPADSGQRRGYRRVEWIEKALEPVRDQLDERRFERLVSALSMLIGWEALTVARDVRELDGTEAAEVSAWAARALLKATLAEDP